MLNKIVQEDIQYIVSQDLDWEQFRDKTVLISGASGFIASYMVETFLYLNKTKKLNIRIIGLVRDLYKAGYKFFPLFNKNLKLLHRDINLHLEIDGEIDYIIHSAGQSTPKVFKNDPVGTILPNIIGTYNLLELAKEKKVKGFLFFSTSGVYGILNENCYPAKEYYSNGYINPLDLSSCYLESKRAGENLCIAYMKQYNVPIKIVRPSIIYGFGVKLDDGKSFTDFISNILNKEDIILYSDGEIKRSYLYIADAVSAFFTVLLKGSTGQAYNIASKREISIIDLASLLINKVSTELNLKVIIKGCEKENYIRINFRQTWMDITRIESLGWKPNFSLVEGFKRTIKSYQLESIK